MPRRFISGKVGAFAAEQVPHFRHYLRLCRRRRCRLVFVSVLIIILLCVLFSRSHRRFCTCGGLQIYEEFGDLCKLATLFFHKRCVNRLINDEYMLAVSCACCG